MKKGIAKIHLFVGIMINQAIMKQQNVGHGASTVAAMATLCTFAAKLKCVFYVAKRGITPSIVGSTAL